MDYRYRVLFTIGAGAIVTFGLGSLANKSLPLAVAAGLASAVVAVGIRWIEYLLVDRQDAKPASTSDSIAAGWNTSTPPTGAVPVAQGRGLSSRGESLVVLSPFLLCLAGSILVAPSSALLMSLFDRGGFLYLFAAFVWFALLTFIPILTGIVAAKTLSDGLDVGEGISFVAGVLVWLACGFYGVYMSITLFYKYVDPSGGG